MSDLSPIIQQVSFAEKNLLEQRRTQPGDAGGHSTGSMGVIFTGNFHHSIPNQLLFDSNLSPADKLLWQILRAFIANPKMPGYVPSREELSAAMVCSAPTVAKSRATLRISRWMTYCRTVRDEFQRFVGDVYLLHEEPLSLADTLELDSGYVQFLEAQVSGASAGKANRNLASQVLAQISALESTPRSPTQLESMEDRLREAVFGKSALITTSDEFDSHVKNFNTALADAEGENTSEKIAINEAMRASEASLEGHDKNFNAGLNSHVKNLNTAFDQNLTEKENSLHGSEKNIFNPRSIGSSSININKYITTRARKEIHPSTETTRRHDADLDKPLAECLTASHLGWLVADTTQPMLFLWEVYRTNIPVIGRVLLGLGEEARRDVMCQLFGRMIFNVKHPGTEPIRNIVSFTKALVDRRRDNVMMLDEWGQMVKEAIEDGEPHFLIGQGGLA